MPSDLIKTKNIFLRQSCDDAWVEYKASVKKNDYVCWDYVIITSSNEAQAQSYREQINLRREKGKLPEKTHYAVIPDPNGERVGSGGATFNVLKYLKENGVKDFCDKKILVIHSGGDSKRVPQYSACGKLFSPVPRVLPDKERSTLFDEFIISMAGVPARMQGGILALSGDVLLLFNPLQLDLQFGDAVSISIKEDVKTGKNHGVFLRGEQGEVYEFCHKMSEQDLRKMGAVNEQGLVDIDTGAVMLSGKVLNSLFELISSNGKIDDTKFSEFVNSKARISFYGDFLYPLAKNATLEKYLKEKPEGEFCEELFACRRKIWEKISGFTLKLLNLSPAEFIHFGTTRELLHLVSEKISDYSHLGWENHVNSFTEPSLKFSSNNSIITDMSEVGEGCYIENSVVGEHVKIGKDCVLSGIEAKDCEIFEGCVMHGLCLEDKKYIVRFYGVNDNPKEKSIFGKPLDVPLWDKPLYMPRESLELALADALLVAKKIKNGEAVDENGRMSLSESFNHADMKAIIEKEQLLYDNIMVMRFEKAVKDRLPLNKVKEIFLNGISERQQQLILEKAETLSAFERMRMIFYLSSFSGEDKADFYVKKAFSELSKAISTSKSENGESLTFVKEESVVRLPVRVNFGGGWSDTPPYCNENGGTVLNAAIKLSGEPPIESCVRRLEEKKVVFESADAGAYREFTDITELQSCYDPFDPFALHKAALIANGVIPKEGNNLASICEKMGGGIYLSTRVINIPRGSGLGTSSILAAACVNALCDSFGVSLSYEEKIKRVLKMEQIMSTGGGWQDQAGGLVPGIKLLKSQPGHEQNVECENLKISPETLSELEERFVIIYTGQRRLARNLLREVMGRYVSSNEESVRILHEIQRIAVLMKFELEKGNVNEFAKLLDCHWDLMKKLDSGCTNTCIEQIFDSSADLLEGKMICGAGGGGFLQAVLKKGVTKKQLSERLKSVFNESGIDVWPCSFYG